MKFHHLILMLGCPVLHSNVELDKFFFLDEEYAEEIMEKATQVIRKENWTAKERKLYREGTDLERIFEGPGNYLDDRLHRKLLRRVGENPPVRPTFFFKPSPSSGMRPIEYLTYFCRQRPVHASFAFLQILFKTMQTWILWRVWLECCHAFQEDLPNNNILFLFIDRLFSHGVCTKVIHYLMMGGFPLLCGYIPSAMIILLSPSDKWMEYWLFAGLRFAFEFISQQNISKELEVLVKEQTADRPISQLFEKTTRFFLQYGESTDLLRAIYEMPEQIFECFKVAKEMIYLSTSILSNVFVRSIYARDSSTESLNDISQMGLIFRSYPGAPVAISFGFTLFAIFCIYSKFSASIFDAEQKLTLLTQCSNKNVTETMNNIMLVLSSNNFGVEFARFSEYLKHETEARQRLDRLKMQMTLMASSTAAASLILDLVLRYFTVVGRRDWHKIRGFIKDEKTTLSDIMKELKNPPQQYTFTRPIFSVGSSIAMDLIAIVQLFILINLVVNGSDIFRQLSISQQVVENPDVEKKDRPMQIAPRDKYKKPEDNPRGAMKIMIGAPGAQYLYPEEQIKIETKSRKIHLQMEEEGK